MLRYAWISALVITLDQLTKGLASSWLALHDSVPVMTGINFTLAHNTGAAFSFLAGYDGWQRVFFIGLTTVISTGLLYWLVRHVKTRMEAIAISLILGGAIGNVIDRIIHGYVVDFIDVYYLTYHWPTFNVADSAIVVGAVVLILDSFIHDDKNKDKGEKA